MKFNVGPGIEEKMYELNDFAIKNSDFVHPSPTDTTTTTEFGYGLRYEYIATNAEGDWEVVAYARNKSN